MLAKDANSRLSVQDVIRDPYVLSFMQGFVESDGKNISKQLTVKKVALKSEGNSPTKLDETPKERMQRLKREKADEEFERMKVATRDAFADNKV